MVFKSALCPGKTQTTSEAGAEAVYLACVYRIKGMFVMG